MPEKQHSVRPGNPELSFPNADATVPRYDRILVLDAGRVMEYDTPRNLILRGGFFAALVRSSSGKRDLYRAVGLDYDGAAPAVCDCVCV